MSVAPARAAALEVLGEVRRRQAYAPAVLDAVLDHRALAGPDRALATRLAYGTLQSEGTLDAALGRYLTRPHLEPRVRDALRLAAYELLFARTPARAVVNEGVEAVRRARPQAAGMANAVLRRLAEDAASFPWGDPDADLAAFARMTAHPLWLAQLLARDLGEDAARSMMLADQSPAPLYLAWNAFRGSLDDLLERLRADGVGPSQCEPPDCIRAASAEAAVRSSAVKEGLAIVMDAAAQVAPLAVDVQPNELVADVAAGRGGKTLLLQAHAVARGGSARIYALDVHEHKVSMLRERMDALGVPDVVALVGDAMLPEQTEGMPVLGSFDRVLVDAPCSNLGTLRRHPEKRWRLRPEDLERLAEIQRRMLKASSRLVRPGGLVVYSTCSVSSAENAGVIESFLAAEGAAFRIERLDDLVPVGLRRFVGPTGMFQSLPEPEGPDGHFVAALRRAN